MPTLRPPTEVGGFFRPKQSTGLFLNGGTILGLPGKIGNASKKEELALLLFGYAMAAAMTQKTARHIAVSTEQTPEAMVASSALLPRPGDR